MALFSHRFINSHKSKDLVILLLVNCAVYIPMLHLFPAFLGDDFVVFDIIRSNGNTPIALDPHTPFFLFTRPLSYLVFWVLYHVGGTNALLMKSIILGVHLAYVVLLYGFFEQINAKLHLNGSRIFIILLCLFLSLHPDALLWVDWISNVNELIMLLLYTLALLFLVHYLYDTRRGSLTLALSTVFFVLSTLAKQQGIHYPLLLALILILLSSTLENKKRVQLLIASIIGLIVVLVQIGINYVVNFQGNEFVTTGDLYKKPFAILGTSLYIFVPLWGNEIYQFFLVHKGISAFVGLISLGSTLVYLRRYPLKRKPILYISLFTLIVFIPRMMGPGGERINSLQILWMTILIFYLGAHYSKKEYLVLLLVLLVSLNIGSIMKVLQRQLRDEFYTTMMNQQLLNIQENRQRPVYILYSSVYLSWPQQFNFIKNGAFGNLNTFYFSGIQARPIVNDFALPSDVVCNVYNDSVVVQSTNILQSYLDLSKHNSSSLILSKHKSIIRGFSKITFQIPDTILSRKPLIVYPQNYNWIITKIGEQ